MAGRFEGLNDLEWKLFEDIFPPQAKRGKGMPDVPFRYVVNSLLYILITGCRWCDLPQGHRWASKSAAHRWLKRWRADGTYEHLKSRILALADGVRNALRTPQGFTPHERGLINWSHGAIDGSFSPWERRRRGGSLWL